MYSRNRIGPRTEPWGRHIQQEALNECLCEWVNENTSDTNLNRVKKHYVSADIPMKKILLHSMMVDGDAKTPNLN